MISELYFERIEAGEECASGKVTVRKLNKNVEYKYCLTDVNGRAKRFASFEFSEVPNEQILANKTLINYAIKSLHSLISAQANMAEKVLVTGIGNPCLTVDSFGSELVDRMRGNVNVMSFKPLTSGITGISSYDVIRGLVLAAKPDLIIAADTLKTYAEERIGRSLQITDDGIQAGSATGSRIRKLCYENLGVPVIALGVPLVANGKIAGNLFGSDVTSAKCEGIIKVYSDFIAMVFNKIFEK